MMAVSFPHHCHISGWLSRKSSIMWKLNKEFYWRNSYIPSPKGSCNAVLHFASFCNILFNFGSHNDDCKLLSSLPHEWLAEWKVQYIIETKEKIILAQFLHTLPLMHVKLCCVLRVFAIYCSPLAAIMMAVSFPHHCHMSGPLSRKSSIM